MRQLYKHPIPQTRRERGSARTWPCGTQKRGVVFGMNTARDTGAIKLMWLNKGGAAAIVPLKVLEKIWPVTYNSRCHGVKCIWHTDQGDIVIKNNSKGMPYLDIRELETKVVLLFIQTVQGNMEGYMRCKVKEAYAVQEAQAARPPNRPRVSRNGTFQHDFELSCNPNCCAKC
jgi:hypothetical protein